MLMTPERERMSGAVTAVLGGLFMIAGLARATDGFTDDAHASPSAILAIFAGVILLAAGAGLISNRYWGWKTGAGAHAIALIVTVFAIFSVAGSSSGVLAVPAVMLVLVLASFAALWRARPRNPMRRMQHNVAAKLY